MNFEMQEVKTPKKESKVLVPDAITKPSNGEVQNAKPSTKEVIARDMVGALKDIAKTIVTGAEARATIDKEIERLYAEADAYVTRKKVDTDSKSKDHETLMRMLDCYLQNPSPNIPGEAFATIITTFINSWNK